MPLALEAERVIPVIRTLANEGKRLSIDTRKAAMMREAVAAGATIVNDISALTFDPKSLSVAAALGTARDPDACTRRSEVDAGQSDL